MVLETFWLRIALAECFVTLNIHFTPNWIEHSQLGSAVVPCLLHAGRMWCLAEQVKANMSTNEVVCTWSNVEWWSWRHIIAARVLIMERLKPLCTDYFNNMRPVHNAASDEQITPKKVWREQKKWIIKNVHVFSTLWLLLSGFPCQILRHVTLSQMWCQGAK